MMIMTTTDRWMRRALALLFPLILLLLLTSCGGSSSTRPAAIASDAPPADDAGHASHADDGEADEVEAGDPADWSVYLLESEWKDQDARARKLSSLAGKVQVVALVYTHCGYACPRIVADLKRIEGEMAAAHPEGVGFVLVSIDPERDTPERLRSFAEGSRLDPARWTLLNGSDAQVLELAALLGVKYRRESATDFSHSNVITVLDPHGVVVHQQLGLGADPAKTLRVIRRLAAHAE